MISKKECVHWIYHKCVKVPPQITMIVERIETDIFMSFANATVSGTNNVYSVQRNTQLEL